MIARVIITGLAHIKNATFCIRQRGIDPAQAHRIFRSQASQRSYKGRFLVPCGKRGDLGFKTGRGFQDWSEEGADASRRRLVEYLVHVLGDEQRGV